MCPLKLFPNKSAQTFLPSLDVLLSKRTPESASMHHSTRHVRSFPGTGQRKRQIASRFKDEPSTEPKKKTTAGWGGRRIKGQKLASIPGVDQLIQKGLSMDELAKLGMKQAGGKYGVGKGGDDAKQSWSDANDGEDVPGTLGAGAGRGFVCFFFRGRMVSCLIVVHSEEQSWSDANDGEDVPGA